MKLDVTKTVNNSQSRIRFVAKFKLELDPEEQQAIDDYSMNDLLLTILVDEANKKELEVRVKDLCGGIQIQTTDAWLAFEFENEIAFASEEFSKYLHKASHYKGIYSLDLPTGETEQVVMKKEIS
jgi:hypothetical protein